MLITNLKELGLSPFNPINNLIESIGDLLLASLPLFGDGLLFIPKPSLPHFIILNFLIEL
jgi:hypothetical protein